jgi:ElaB/YqjD/DUF883 family membrane-anchored ribosome-binding protein
MLIMEGNTELAREMLVADFKALVADAEELLRLTADDAGEKAGAMRERIHQRLRMAKSEVDRIEASALRKVRGTLSATDSYVHVHPWTTVGIAAGAALLVGMLISRR